MKTSSIKAGLKKASATKLLIAPPAKDAYVSTGITLLNLALTGNPFRGWAKGYYYLLVGNSSSGKTMLMLSAMAECAHSKRFTGHRLVYDATTEDGAKMDVARLFGSKTAERVGVIRSDTAEAFYYNLDDLFKSGIPFVYTLDSENGLDSFKSDAKFSEDKKKVGKGEAPAGSYGDGKPKIHSEYLRRTCGNLTKHDSILLVSSQTRDNLDGGLYGPKDKRSGGRALKFWASLEVWTAVKEKIKRKVNGKDRTIGITIRATVKKNRFTGKEREVLFDFYYDAGFDDIGSNIDFLLAEKHWTSGGAVIKAPEFKFSGSREDLISKIEAENKERDLQMVVWDVWQSIEDRCSVNRKRRYD